MRAWRSQHAWENRYNRISRLGHIAAKWTPYCHGPQLSCVATAGKTLIQVDIYFKLQLISRRSNGGVHVGVGDFELCAAVAWNVLSITGIIWVYTTNSCFDEVAIASSLQWLLCYIAEMLTSGDVKWNSGFIYDTELAVWWGKETLL